MAIICLSIFQYISAQNKQIYISRHGGEKNALTFGKVSYDYYHFVSNCGVCDTLICSGAGYEVCKIDKAVIKNDKTNAPSYKTYNKAIKITERYIKKRGVTSGNLSLEVNNQKVLVTFYNANKIGEADIEIKIL